MLARKVSFLHILPELLPFIYIWTAILLELGPSFYSFYSIEHKDLTGLVGSTVIAQVQCWLHWLVKLDYMSKVGLKTSKRTVHHPVLQAGTLFLSLLPVAIENIMLPAVRVLPEEVYIAGFCWYMCHAAGLRADVLLGLVPMLSIGDTMTNTEQRK